MINKLLQLSIDENRSSNVPPIIQGQI